MFIIAFFLFKIYWVYLYIIFLLSCQGVLLSKKIDSVPPFSPDPEGVPCNSNLRIVSNIARLNLPETPPADPSVRLTVLTTPKIKDGRSLPPPATPRLDKRNSKGETLLHAACVKVS